MPIFRVKSVKIHTGPKKITRAPLVVLVTNIRYGYLSLKLINPSHKSIPPNPLAPIHAPLNTWDTLSVTLDLSPGTHYLSLFTPL